MRNLKIFSATEARNNWFEILNWVNTERKEVWIKKRNTIIARIYPGETPIIGNVDEIIKQACGFLKGKKGIFPYQENKKVIKRERKYLKKIRSWKIR